MGYLKGPDNLEHEWISFGGTDTVCLDGWFTIEQLEFIISVMKGEKEPEWERDR